MLKFLLDLFKYNDNSKNSFSDNYYRAAMVEALGETVTPVVSVMGHDVAITADALSNDTKQVNLSNHPLNLLESFSSRCISDLGGSHALPEHGETVTLVQVRRHQCMLKSYSKVAKDRTFAEQAGHFQGLRRIW